jgi:D-alanine-D-alanine ligase
VAVILGGTSGERAVSLKSGRAVLDGLQSAGVHAFAIDYQGRIDDLQSAGPFDRAFLAVHGRGGEDGTLQALMEILGRPYTGSGVMSSALAMDKVRTKSVWLGMGLPTPKFVYVNAHNRSRIARDVLLYPLAVKAAREGSSIGVYKVDSRSELDAAIDAALQYDSLVLIEQWIEGGEFTVGILNGEALPVIGLKTDHVFYDYDAKYQSDTTQYLLPSGLDENDDKRIKTLALEAFQTLDCRGWGRIDVMQDGQGNFWLLEANTIPGMTDHSLVPMAARAAGLDFAELVVRIARQTLET